MNDIEIYTNNQYMLYSQTGVSECPDIKNYKWQLNPV